MSSGLPSRVVPQRPHPPVRVRHRPGVVPHRRKLPAVRCQTANIPGWQFGQFRTDIVVSTLRLTLVVSVAHLAQGARGGAGLR